MTIRNNAMPLIGVEAVALDSETTALDPKVARLVEIAAIPLSQGTIRSDKTMWRLVRPDIPIPATATAIHGIGDSAVAECPNFAAVWPSISAFIGERIVIGHAIGFDLAVLSNECSRAALSWHVPGSLCTRLLSQLVDKQLGDYSLDQLAARLGIAIERRHSAVGDATAAARIFLALVPLLREQGIRTLAEAESACRALPETARQHTAGWVEPTIRHGDRTAEIAETVLFRRRVRDLMSAPQFATPDMTIRSAIERLSELRISSLFLVSDTHSGPPTPDVAAIATERDLLRAIATHGDAALLTPVSAAASRPIQSVSGDDFLYRAIAQMRSLKIRHLGVTDEAGNLCGAVSARDLLKQRAEEALWLGEEIDEAGDVPSLARAWARIPAIAESLLAENLSGVEIAAVISQELGALSRRAAVIAERRMIHAGQGGPPCPYALALLGSGGRGESLLAMDQDNAIVFDQGDPGSAADLWFAALGSHIADILDEAGVPYCKGGVMARNPEWRGSGATWRDRVASWVRRAKAHDLLSVDIFFDMRAVHGDVALAASLRRDAFELAAAEVPFAKLLAEAAGTPQSSIGWFGRIRTQDGRIDLKRAGLFAIVSAARVLAIRHHVTKASTPERLRSLSELGLGSAMELDELLQAYELLLRHILEQQIEDLANGVPPSNKVALHRLDAIERVRLRSALVSIAGIDDLVRNHLF